jgi:hypothetical protein
MKNTLLITVSVAALVAASGGAFAQGMNQPRDQPAAAAPMEKGKTDRLKMDAPQKAESPQKSDTTKPQKAEAPQKSDAVKTTPTAQLPAKPTGAKSETSEKTETSGQAGGMQPAQRNEAAPNDRAGAKGPAQADAHAAPPALSSEQHAKVSETIRGEKVAPFNGVKFSVTVGESVPANAHLYQLPVRILEYAPQYRGYEYILVGDDILIVDPHTHRIVAVIAA